MTSHFYLTRIMPIGLFMALTLFFGNVVYLYLSVSFIQMLKVCGSQQLGVTVLCTGVQLLVTGKSSAWNRTSERSMLPVEQTSVCTGQPSIWHLTGASECNLVGHPGWQPGRAKVPSTLRCSVPMHRANLAHISRATGLHVHSWCVQAFTPIVTMVALFCAQMETPTKRLISAVCVIAVGTAIASYGEVHLSTLGVIFMFSSEMFEAIRLVMTQMLLVGLKLHPSESHLSVVQPREGSPERAAHALIAP